MAVKQFTPMTIKRGDEVFVRGFDIAWHKGIVTDTENGRTPYVTVQYFDNARRGIATKHGRTYNHGTRRSICQPERNVRLVPDADSEINAYRHTANAE